MNAREALGRLWQLRVPAVTTGDAAAVLGVSVGAASQTLRRLSFARLVTPLRKGLWALGSEPERLALAEYITAPYPSYISLQTALYQRGMISQIPSMIFVVSLARSVRVSTPLGIYSIHNVRPDVFGGFEVLSGSRIKLASAEKALFDFLYLSPTGGGMFAALPELELPCGFKKRVAYAWVARIQSSGLRSYVERKLQEMLSSDHRT